VRRLLFALALVSGLGLLVRGAVPCSAIRLQPQCYVALHPGPATDAIPYVELGTTTTYAPTGELVLTTVEIDPDLDFLEWIRTALSDQVEQVPRELVYPPEQTRDEAQEESVAQMDQSQLDATIAGLRAAGFTVGDGAEVAAVEPGSGADGVLVVGDVIVAIDGTPVGSDAEGVAQLAGKHPGDRVVLAVRSGGTRDAEPVEVVLGPDPADPARGILGVAVVTFVDQLPVDVSIDAGNVGGPSGGLMFALAIVDLLGDEDLTGGRVIAGTGTIDAQGVVGPIGGVQQKLLGAIHRGTGEPATVFLVPAGQTFDEAVGTAVDREVLLVPVVTLADAITALRDLNAGRQPASAMALGTG